MSDLEERRVKINVIYGNQCIPMNIRRDAPLKILMKKLCEIRGLHINNIRFMDPDNRRIQQRDTANKLGLEDGDYIDTFPVQVGGASPDQ